MPVHRYFNTSLVKRNISSAKIQKKVEIRIKKNKNIETIDAICSANSSR